MKTIQHPQSPAPSSEHVTRIVITGCSGDTGSPVYLLTNTRNPTTNGIDPDRHNEGANYGYVDGHAKYGRPGQVNGACFWDPASMSPPCS